MYSRLTLLYESNQPINMGIHPTKPLFTTMNVDDEVTEPFVIGDSIRPFVKKRIYPGIYV